MAVEGKAIIFYRCNLFFYFVSIHERPAVGSQQNVASGSEMVSINKCLQKFRGPSPNIWGAKTSNFGPHFPRLQHPTPHISRTKRRIDKQKCYCQSTICLLQVDLLSVTFDPKTAEIRLLIVTQHSADHASTSTYMPNLIEIEDTF